ncbi:hypothetical protein [Paenibacillus sp. UMB4589-SE434]|uniref:hypothetical protein n=1 Tax=Paenibacillus sp. UMB4589-SE434 TaxID=3046314 RepID=UPI00254F1C47|nr:hypothetical protein [Paenibacillus sp. UMB4589-SE434]MDK8182074.1 hypothetical protein [Paenibacillus sp. UMB4589-SE434]
MRMAVRIKAEEDMAAQRCLYQVGGKIVLPAGKQPQFHFPSGELYDEYCKLLRIARGQK